MNDKLADTVQIVAVCLAVVGVAWAVAWAKVTNEPRYATGIDSSGKPYCQSYLAERACPTYFWSTKGSG